MARRGRPKKLKNLFKVKSKRKDHKNSIINYLLSSQVYNTNRYSMNDKEIEEKPVYYSKTNSNEWFGVVCGVILCFLLLIVIVFAIS